MVGGAKVRKIRAVNAVSTPKQFDERLKTLVRDASKGGVPLHEVSQSLAGFLLASVPMLGMTDDELFERMRETRARQLTRKAERAQA